MGQYIVSARKYRPGTFDEVIGQEHVTQTLKTALQKGQLAQAYLFTGPRGVGKTTCARILAKVVNCENPIDGNTPCNECDSCKAFNENNSFNIFEFDAASNNSVDNIRMLIDEQVRYMPQKGKYKVFIIDEVHMLSKAAFNAFLKTLEEPPAHVIFILATTEKHKILPTILSRCQIYDFRTIQIKDIVRQLEIISEKEGVEIETEALHIIAKKADGAMRDALSIYDRIVSSVHGEKITYKHVLQNLNLLDYDYYFKMTDFILNKDVSNVLLLFNKVVREGFDINLFVTGLAEHFRQLLVSKDPKTLELIEAGEKLTQRYLNQSGLLDRDFALSALNILNQCDYTYPMAQNKRLHVEIALSKLCHIQDLLQNRTHINQQEKKKPEPADLIPEKSPAIEKNKFTEEKSAEKKDEAVKDEIKKENTATKNETPEATAATTFKAPGIEKKIKSTSKIVGFPKIDQILEEVKKEEGEKKEKLPLDLEKIKDLVSDLKNTHTSKMVINVLNELDFEIIDDDNLHVFVPTRLAKDVLLQEKDLFTKIREAHHNPLLDIEIKVDIKRFPEHKEMVTKKVLTTKDKYELLIKGNPAIKDFIKTLDLHLDS